MKTDRPAKIKRLALKNVLSWREGDFDLHPGLNVVVGPSDSGKTNVYRALRAIVENAPASRLLSVGESAGCATVVFEDDVSVSLQKGVGKANSNRYIKASPQFGPEEFNQVGADCPPPVSSALRLGEVDLSGIPVDVHFSAQRGPAFGVDTKPGDLAKIIGSICGLDVVYVALADAEKGRKDSAAEDTKANADFVEKRDRYRRVQQAFPEEKIAALRDEITGAHRSSLAASERAEELSGLAESIRSAAVRTSSLSGLVRSAEEAMAPAAALVGKISKAVERESALRLLAGDMKGIIDEIDELQADESVAVREVASAEAEVHALCRTDCPLCGRKGKP